MAYSTINKSSDYMNTVLYSGDSSTQSITGVGFQPDWVWLKNRDAADSHCLFDAVRGATKVLSSDANTAETTDADTLTSFDSDGFALGDDVKVNTNTEDYVSWNWKAGTTSGLTGGTITPSSYSINSTSGFGIYKWTGTGATGTITHGLGSTPKMIIFKVYDYNENWIVYDSTNGATNFMRFNQTNATGTNSTMFNDTEPTDTLFTVGSHNATNKSGNLCIAYVFADVQGFSKFGSYTGNGNADGNFIYTGFRPAFILLKNTGNASAEWRIYDNKRDTSNVMTKCLQPHESDAEQTTSNIDFLSNGWKVKSNDGNLNQSGYSFIYMAFGQPIISNSGVVATAR